MSRKDETDSPSPDNRLHDSSLQDFGRRLAAARKEAGLDREAEDDGVPARSRAWAGALRASADLAAALLVGLGLGLMIDRLAGTGPWAMLAGLFLGFATGLRNAMRTARRLNDEDASAR